MFQKFPIKGGKEPGYADPCLAGTRCGETKKRRCQGSPQQRRFQRKQVVGVHLALRPLAAQHAGFFIYLHAARRWNLLDAHKDIHGIFLSQLLRQAVDENAKGNSVWKVLYY